MRYNFKHWESFKLLFASEDKYNMSLYFAGLFMFFLKWDTFPIKLNNINVDMLVESLMINVVIKAVEYCRGNLFWFREDQLQAGVPEFSFEKCLLDGEQSKGVTTQPKFNGWKFKIFWNFYESNIGIIMQYISTGQIQHWSFACIHKTWKKR